MDFWLPTILLLVCAICQTDARHWTFSGHYREAENNLKEFDHDKRPLTGYYANKNSQKSILIDGRWFADPPGGVEAMIQISLAMTGAAHESEVYVTHTNYHTRWEQLFSDALIKRMKQPSELQEGDIYIHNEGMGCVQGVPPGVQVFVYILANVMCCPPSAGVRYISHNHFLTTYQQKNEDGTDGERLFLPPERVIHPYISPFLVEHSFHRTGLQHNGLILYEKSQLKDIKENLVLLDNDIPGEFVEKVKSLVAKVNGTALRLDGLSREELLSAYERGKVVIDWCMRGSERCPQEAAIFGAITITNDCETGSDFNDTPIPSKYILPTKMEDVDDDSLVELFRDSFDNYWQRLSLFEPYRRSILDHNPSTMIKESIRFLATTHITTSSNATSLDEKGCLACRDRRLGSARIVDN